MNIIMGGNLTRNAHKTHDVILLSSKSGLMSALTFLSSIWKKQYTLKHIYEKHSTL